MAELKLEMAERAAKAAQAKAKEMKAPITVVVVDDGGNLVYAARDDGTGPFNVDTTRAKCVAAVAFRKTTKELQEVYNEDPVWWSSMATVLGGRVLLAVGAVPVRRQGRVIGAVGCGGGSMEADHECALAGAAVLSE